MVKFIEKAKNEGIIVLAERIKEAQRQMGFLLENFLFQQEDIDLNTKVLLWPSDIGPVFDANEELTAEVRGTNDNILMQKREKLMIELDKIQKRVDEFTDYGELEMMREYVDDVKTVQKRIAENETLIDWIRNVNKYLLKSIHNTFNSLNRKKLNLDFQNQIFHNLILLKIV
jgi:dynein heavy chain